jgi:hypothetical protein
MPILYPPWAVEVPGWGLLDARTGKMIHPSALISDERIEMTDWELNDYAVQVVRDHLQKAGRKLMSWTSDPEVEPSIWFVGDGGPEAAAGTETAELRDAI